MRAVAARRTKGTLGGWRPGAGRKREIQNPVQVTIDFERPDRDALAEHAAERGESMSAAVRRIVGAYLRRQRRR